MLEGERQGRKTKTTPYQYQMINHSKKATVCFPLLGSQWFLQSNTKSTTKFPKKLVNSLVGQAVYPDPNQY